MSILLRWSSTTRLPRTSRLPNTLRPLYTSSISEPQASQDHQICLDHRAFLDCQARRNPWKYQRYQTRRLQPTNDYKIKTISSNLYLCLAMSHQILAPILVFRARNLRYNANQTIISLDLISNLLQALDPMSCLTRISQLNRNITFALWEHWDLRWKTLE